MDARAADAFTTSFARSLGMITGLQDQQDQRSRQQRFDAERAEDRAQLKSDRSRAMQLQDIALDQATADRRRRIEREDVQDANAAEDRQYQVETRETPAEIRARRGQENAARGLSLASARFNLGQAQADAKRKVTTQSQDDALPVLRELATVMDSGQPLSDNDLGRLDAALKPFGTSLDLLTSDRYAQAHDALERLAEDGEMNPQALEALNSIYGSQINRTAGEKLAQPVQRGGKTLPAGTVIGQRRIVGLKPHGDEGAYAVLEVEYQTPDGKSGKYLAPVTGDRMAGGDADPKLLRYDDFRRNRAGQQVLRQTLLAADPTIKTRIAALTSARDTAGTGRRGGTGAQQYLKYVADNVFGGDIKQAYASIRGGNTRQIAASMAGKMAELQKNLPRQRQQPYETLYQEAIEILQGAAAESGGSPEGMAPPAAGQAGAGGGEEDFSALWGGN